MFSRSKFFYALFFAVLVFLLDIGSKQLILRTFVMNEVREVTGFFNLVLVMNSGAAFSLFSGGGEGQGLKMAALSIVALVPLALLYRLAGKEDRLQLASLGVIFGGAFGNIHDRLRWSAVVDFLDFHIYGRHWPAFNVADIAVVAGLGLFIVSLIVKTGKRDQAGKFGKPGNAGKSGNAGKAGKPGKPGEAGKPGKPGKPGKAGKPVKAGRP